MLAFAVASITAEPKASVALPVAVAPAVAPAAVLAQSSQVIARNYNALVAPVPAAQIASPVIAPARIAAPFASLPYVAAPRFAAPYAAVPGPYII